MNISSQLELMCGLRLVLIIRPWLLNAREAKFQTTVTTSTLIIVDHARSGIVGIAISIDRRESLPAAQLGPRASLVVRETPSFPENGRPVSRKV